MDDDILEKINDISLHQKINVTLENNKEFTGIVSMIKRWREMDSEIENHFIEFHPESEIENSDVLRIDFVGVDEKPSLRSVRFHDDDDRTFVYMDDISNIKILE